MKSEFKSLLVFTIISLLIWNTTYGQSKSDNKYSSILEQGITKGYPGLIVGIQKNNESRWIGSAGYSNLESRIKMSSNETFHLASITKLFTAIATLQLVDEKKISLNSKVIDILDDPAVKSIPNLNEITVSQLLDHSSGIYSFNNDMEYIETLLGTRVNDSVRWTSRDLLLLAREHRVEPQGDPGSGHYYSDANYVLLGLIIEKMSGKAFRHYIKYHILNPLKLQHTGFYDTHSDETKMTIKPTANGYLQRSEILDGFISLDSSFKEVKPGLVNTSTAGERIDASAGMVGTIDDLLTLGNALYLKQLLSPNSLEWLLSIGNEIEKDPINTKRQGIVTVRNTAYGVIFTSLGDGGGGMNTMLAFHPTSNTLVAAFTNVFGNFNEHDFFIDELIPAIFASKE